MVGLFYCTKTCKIQIKRSELKDLANIDVKMYVTEMNGHYEIILGQNILTKLGLVLDFEQKKSSGAMKSSRLDPQTVYRKRSTLSTTCQIYRDGPHVKKIGC